MGLGKFYDPVSAEYTSASFFLKVSCFCKLCREKYINWLWRLWGTEGPTKFDWICHCCSEKWLPSQTQILLNLSSFKTLKRDLLSPLWCQWNNAKDHCFHLIKTAEPKLNQLSARPNMLNSRKDFESVKEGQFPLSSWKYNMINTTCEDN